MKNSTSMQQPMFIYSPLPLTTSWTENRRALATKPRVLSPWTATTDEFGASKPEIVCGGVLALCFFYTLFHCLVQLAS